MFILFYTLFAEDIGVSKSQYEKLFSAIKNKDTKTIGYFLNTIDDMNYADELGNNALIYAVQNNNLTLVKTIIDKGININHYNVEHSNALIEACKISNYEITEILLINSINIYQVDINGNQALYYAERNSNSNIISLLNYYSNLDRKKVKKNKKDGLDDFIKNFNTDPINEI